MATLKIFSFKGKVNELINESIIFEDHITLSCFIRIRVGAG